VLSLIFSNLKIYPRSQNLTLAIKATLSELAAARHLEVLLQVKYQEEIADSMEQPIFE